MQPLRLPPINPVGTIQKGHGDKKGVTGWSGNMKRADNKIEPDCPSPRSYLATTGGTIRLPKVDGRTGYTIRCEQRCRRQRRVVHIKPREVLRLCLQL